MTDQQIDATPRLAEHISLDDLRRLSDNGNGNGNGHGHGNGHDAEQTPAGHHFDPTAYRSDPPARHPVAPPDSLRDIVGDPDPDPSPYGDSQARLAARRQHALERRQAARERLMAQKRQQVATQGALQDTLSVVGVLLAILFSRVFVVLNRGKLWFNCQPPLLRGLTLITISLVMMIFVGFFFAGEVRAYLEGEKVGPVLEEALADPYGLDGRFDPTEADTARSVLPSVVFNFNRTASVLSKENSSSLLNHCVLGIPVPFEYDKTCVRTIGALDTASARYMSRNEMADLTVSRFTNEAAAERTMLELLHYAREIGQVGNFSVAGVGPVDYFYSLSRGWTSFTWSRGAWVYTVSASSFEALENIVNELNY